MNKVKRIISLFLIVVLSICILNVHVFAADYGNWKQWDTKWGNIWLGNNSETTMGDIGCRVTSIAIVCAKLDLVDENFTPGTFANGLKKIGAFTSTGAMNNWTDPEKIVNGLEMVKKVELTGMSTAEKAKVISQYTTNGYACTICVKSGGHYVAGDYVSGDTVYIHDPGYNNRTKLFDSYSNSGITSIRVFKRTDGKIGKTEVKTENDSSSSTVKTEEKKDDNKKTCWWHISYNSSGYCKKCGTEYDMDVKTMSATTYQAVKNDVPVRNRPYSPEKITKWLSKGTEVTVVASGKNSAGNLWYKLNDGSWIYSKNLEKSKSTGTVETTKPTVEVPNYPSLSTAKQTIGDGVYVIATKLNTNYVLDIADASKDNGANLQLWKNNGTAAQTFKVTHVGNEYYQIVNTNSGKAIDVQNGDTAAGTNVWQYKINNSDAQLWKIVNAGSGSYYIIGKGSGLYLDVDNASADYGTNVKIFDRNDAYDAQKWIFTKVSLSSSSPSSSTTSTSSSQATTSSTSIRFELESVPTGNLPYGKSFSLKGRFRSDCAIVEARAYMLDANKNLVMQSDKASSTTSNYKIQGYKLDKAMKFDQLSPGGYYLKYFVRDANGDTATWMSDMFYIVK